MSFKLENNSNLDQENINIQKTPSKLKGIFFFYKKNLNFLNFFFYNRFFKKSFVSH